jgi:integrase/recombinase XerD
VNIRLDDVDFERCQIRINAGKGNKDRIVPFPVLFKEVLAMHVDRMHQQQATYLFESSWKRKYTDRGIRKILAKYAEEAGLSKPISPHQLRHFLLNKEFISTIQYGIIIQLRLSIVELFKFLQGGVFL